MATFQVGDKVKCIQTEHPAWADSVMEVVKLWHTGLIECIHPKKGNGRFFTSQLELVETEKSLEEQKQALQKQIDKINIAIANEKEKAMRQIGDKEVEIKLTLNELALVVADTGVQNTHSAKDNLESLGFNSLFGLVKYIEDGGHTRLYDKLNDLYIGSIK